MHYGPTPQTSNPTHSNVTAPDLCSPEEHSGLLSNVVHGAEDPSNNVSSRYRPYRPGVRSSVRQEESKEKEMDSPTAKREIIRLAEGDVLVLPRPLVHMKLFLFLGSGALFFCSISPHKTVP